MVVAIDRPNLIEALLKIDNKEGHIVPFRFNKGQAYFNRNKSHRNIVLKHRQGGWSSSILADMYIDCITIPMTKAAVVSHETHATQRLLDRVHFYHESMDDPKPNLGADSRSEIAFPDTLSSIYIGTAGSRAFGRGDTIRKCLLSELAFYEDARSILNAVQDAVPMSGELTIECTPNGEDNPFYEEWVKAREGKSPYKPFFFPWWWTEEYKLPRESELTLIGDRGELHYSTDEEELIRKFHLTEEQIRWRRYKIAEKQGLFWQEYPEDEVSCFITIGDPVFDTDILNTLAQSCYDGQKHLDGWLFWQPPEPKMVYTIGVDTSAGAPGGSYSAACVINARFEVVATFQARIEPHILALLLKKLGKWYNMAEIAVERNFTGYAVLGHLLDYPNIYHQRDFVSGKITTNRGWWTNDQTRQYMITAMKERLPTFHTWDMNLVRQLRSFRFIKKETKYEATAQTFDDLAMATMIAVAVRKVLGVSTGYQGATKGWSW
jgi:hypothetical protein